MAALTLLFDGLVASGLLFLSWRSLQAPHLFTSVVLFIAFGLLMALAWVRLEASDIALAEAAIGAGITGALLLDALGHVAAAPDAVRSDQPESLGRSRPVPEQHAVRSAAIKSIGHRGRWALAALVASLAATVAFGLWTMPDGRLVRDAVAGALEHHPVANPATAVLLDFRAYDTFLEMAVLALAALGALLLRARTLDHPGADPPLHGSLILAIFTARLVPLMMLMAGYLFWAGTARSGGAFPAGAILGATAILLFLAGIGREMIVDDHRTRLVIALGLLTFMAAGAATMVAGRAFFDWGEDWTYAAIIAIEALLTLSIGGVLGLLYAASAKVPPDSAREGAPDSAQGTR